MIQYQKSRGLRKKSVIKRRKQRLLSGLMLAIALFVSCSGMQGDNKRLKVDKGILDLRGAGVPARATLTLSGQWEYYGSKLYVPADFSSAHAPRPDGFIQIPGTWDRQAIEGKRLSPRGYATFRCRILLDSGNVRAGILVPGIFTAYKLWINSELVVAQGTVGTQINAVVPRELPAAAFFCFDGDTTQIILQIANFHHNSGGVPGAITIGRNETIQVMRYWHIAFDLFLMGALLIIGLYHLAFYFLRSKGKETLFFALFCLLIFIRQGFSGTKVFLIACDGITWFMLLKASYIASYLAVPMILSFLYYVFPPSEKRSLVQVFHILTIAFISIILITPAQTFVHFAFLYEATVIPAVICYAFYIMVRAAARKQNEVYIVIAGFAAITVTTVNDILYQNHIINTTDLVSVGVLIFIFSQAYILAVRFSRAFSSEERLSLELEQLNANLESQVIIKTQELRDKNEQLKRSNAELEQFAHVASHDLQEPLRMVASYLQLLENRNAGKLDAASMEFIGYAVDGALRMKRLIEDLLKYSRVGTKAKDFRPLECEMVLSVALKNLEVAISESGARIEHGPLPQLLGDEGQMVQLFQNLIGNAIKFCKGRTPIIRIAAHDDGAGFWKFSVQDNGIGIAPKHFEKIFEIFQRLHTREEFEGTGIGLSVCKKIVEQHRGRIWVDSQIGNGTTFFFLLPGFSGNRQAG